MECFKEISPECQEETAIDALPLYQNSPVTVAESSLLLMAFAVRHKLSGLALEDLLELIQFHCPKPNECITELKEFQLFFQALKHPVLKHFYCPNNICKVYIGTSHPESGAKCAVCGTTVSSSSYFIEIPIVEQLRTILSGTVFNIHMKRLMMSGLVFMRPCFHSIQNVCTSSRYQINKGKFN